MADKKDPSREKLKAALHQFKNEGGFVYASQHDDAEALLDAIDGRIVELLKRRETTICAQRRR
jgi:hypothetical protein